MIRILSTKKLRPNQRQFLLNAGFAVTDADFISVRPNDFTLSNINENLIFTSSHAVYAVSNHPQVQDIRRNLSFCVGEKTAALLDEYGFTVQEIAHKAADLAATITAQYTSERFTFFSGNQRLDELPDALHKSGVAFNEIEVYQTAAAPQSMHGNFDGVLFFSPSGVESYLLVNAITNQKCFCIGLTTAKALAGITNNVIIAHQPSVENTIIQAINHYNQKSKSESQNT